MTDKLILLNGGKLLYAPERQLEEDEARTLAEAFKEFSGDPKQVIAILGIPVEVVDHRELGGSAPVLTIEPRRTLGAQSDD